MSERVRAAIETIHFDHEFIVQHPDVELSLEAGALQITVERMQSEQEELTFNPDEERSQFLVRSMVRLSELLVSVREEMAAYGKGLFTESVGSQPSERIVGYSAHGSQLIRDLFGDTAGLALTGSDARGLVAAIEAIKAPKKPLYRSSIQKITAFLLEEETNTTAVPEEQAHLFMGRFVEERMVNQDELDHRRSVLEEYIINHRLRPHQQVIVPARRRVTAPEYPRLHEKWSLETVPPTERDEEVTLAWQEDALCAQTDPEAFFPEKGGTTRDAKRICRSCDVQEECLDYALQHNVRFGIWGGKSERELRAILKLRTQQTL